VNLQEIHNKITKHLLAQNKRAYWRRNSCGYRSPDGLKCAIGCLIADEFYTPELEQKSTNSKLVADALKKSGITPELLETDKARQYLRSAQHIHDSASVTDWSALLKNLAAKHNLQHPKIEVSHEQI
jgi:hypothetical protein